jgi:antitoxin component YwqK of YwqJK toxin-antitoxin module
MFTMPGTEPSMTEPTGVGSDLALPLENKSALDLVEERDSQDILILRCWLRDGVLHGLMERFWPDGKPQLRVNYDAGKMDGMLYVFDEDGSPAQLAAYVQGRQQGLTRVYSKGQCISEQSFVNGLAHGPSIARNEAGQPSVKMQFRKGQIEGPATFFHEGKVVRESHYLGGLLEGEASDFDRDGGLVQVATYRANVLNGTLRRYWPGGALMEEVIYHEGAPVAPPLRLDAKGRQLDNDEAKLGLLARLEKLVKG